MEVCLPTSGVALRSSLDIPGGCGQRSVALGRIGIDQCRPQVSAPHVFHCGVQCPVSSVYLAGAVEGHKSSTVEYLSLLLKHTAKAAYR